MWGEGDDIAGLHCFRGRPWHVWAGRVVRDAPDLLAVWLPRGSEWLRPVGSLFGDWTHEPKPISAPQLRLSVPGAAHSILHFWSETDEFLGWYVNLEEPLPRTPVGYAYDDHLLDVWIRANGRWEWLDEDELGEAVERGFVSEAKAVEIRAEGQRVVEAWPFPTGWEDWQPDPAWQAPRLPTGWNVGA